MGERSRWAPAVLFAVIALTMTVQWPAVGAGAAETGPPATGSGESAGTVRPPVLNHAASDVVVVAHRAASGGAPEQTAAAMRRAVAMRPGHIEVDVQLSADGVPVLVHDKTFARTTNVEKVFPGRAGDPVGTFSYAEIKRLDAGGWFGADFEGERIPTLASVVGEVDGTGVGVFLELKNPAGSPGLEAAVDEVLDADYRWLGVDVTFLSFDASSLHRMAKLRSQERLLWISPEVPGRAELKRLAGWADELGTDYRNLSAGEVARAHAAGLPVAAYTVNTERAQAWVLSLNIDTLITDYPERVPLD